ARDYSFSHPRRKHLLRAYRPPHPFRCERHRAQPHADSVENRVGDRRTHDCRGRLARAPRPFLRPVDEIDDDLWYFRELQAGIALPVDARHGGPVPLQVLDQRAAHRLDDVAVDLVAQPVGVDDLAAVVRHEEALDADLAGAPVYLDIGYDADVRSH